MPADPKTTRLHEPGFQFRHPTPLLEMPAPRAAGEFVRRMEAAAEELRELHEAGKIDWQGVNSRWAYEMAGLEDDDGA